MKWLTRAVLPLFLLLFSGFYGLYAQGHQEESQFYPKPTTTTPVLLSTDCIQQAGAQLSILQTVAERGKDKLESADNEDEEEEVTTVKKGLYTGNHFAAYFARAPGSCALAEAAFTSRNTFSYSSLQRYILLCVIRI